MKEFMKKITKKQKIVSVVVLVVLILGTIGGFVLYKTLNKGEAMATLDMAMLYQDEIVSTTDIIVGISETGTASLVYEEIDLDTGYEVTEVIAVSGVYVNEGDVLATIDLDQSEELYSEEIEELADAESELESLIVTTESKKVEALNTYNESIAAGEMAELVYTTTIDSIDDGLSEIEDDITEMTAYVTNWQIQVNDAYGWEDAIAEVAAIEASIEAKSAEIAVTTDETTLATLNAELANLQASLAEPQSTIDYFEGLKSDIITYNARIESRTDDKETYVSTMPTSKAKAQSTYDSTITTYGNAYELYTLTIEALDEALESAYELVDDKQYALDTADEEDDAIVIDESGNLLAPCSGYIMSVSEPDTFTIDDTTVETGLSITVSDGDYVEIEVSISQDDIADLYIGMETNIIFDAYEDIMLTAQLDTLSLNPSGDMTSSVNYTVSTIVEIPQDEGMTIFSSMTAAVTFVEQQRNDVLAISTNYIIYEDGVQYVYLEKEDGSIEKTVVETGFSDGFDVEITSGLEEGDVVKNESAVSNIEN
ncbi:MAG: hypothetical protein R3Y58_09525 [Eubacteriales bacterium]